MLRLKSILHSIQNQREKIVVSVFALAILYLVSQNVFVQTWLQRLMPVTHVLTSNTLPVDLAWSYHSKEAIIVPPMTNSEIVVLHGNNLLTALDNRTGQVKWEYDIDRETKVPWSRYVFDLNEDLLITSISNDHLLALDAKSGHEVWQTRPSSPTRTTPNIMIVDDVIVVSAFSREPTTEGYVASYRLSNGTLVWDKYLPSRSYEYTFRCPFIPIGNNSTSEKTICLSLYNSLEVIEPAPETSKNTYRLVSTLYHSLPSRDPPYFQDGVIFTNPSPGPSIHVFDVIQNKQFELPTNCSKKRVAQPVTAYSNLILIATGCDELYVLDIRHLEREPNWIYRSPDNLFSSFVTMDGKTGYVLNERGEIMAIDLSNGNLIGKFTTEPNRLERGQFVNSLSVSPPYLYAILNGNNLFVFKQDG